MDRNQKHNVFVMVEVLKKRRNYRNVVSRFRCPENTWCNRLFAVFKKSCYESFNLGRVLCAHIIDRDRWRKNMGHSNGLVANLKELRNSCGSNLPLLSIWCVPHRINLAWKSASKINIIASLITRARKLSTHFHKSAKRTSKLNDVNMNCSTWIIETSSISIVF